MFCKGDKGQLNLMYFLPLYKDSSKSDKIEIKYNLYHHFRTKMCADIRNMRNPCLHTHILSFILKQTLIEKHNTSHALFPLTSNFTNVVCSVPMMIKHQQKVPFYFFNLFLNIFCPYFPLFSKIDPRLFGVTWKEIMSIYSVGYIVHKKVKRFE